MKFKTLNLYKMLGYIISDKEEINVEEHEIYSFDILHKTNLNIFVVENNKVLCKNYIINWASEKGQIQVLEWFKNSGYDFNYDGLATPYYFFGFINSCYKYDDWAINNASINGHIQILEWFKNSGNEFKYNKNAIIWTSNFKILEWFKNRNVKKVIKWSNSLKFNKTIRYKTKNNYIKGYNKN